MRATRRRVQDALNVSALLLVLPEVVNPKKQIASAPQVIATDSPISVCCAARFAFSCAYSSISERFVASCVRRATTVRNRCFARRTLARTAPRVVRKRRANSISE